MARNQSMFEAAVDTQRRECSARAFAANIGESGIPRPASQTAEVQKVIDDLDARAARLRALTGDDLIAEFINDKSDARQTITGKEPPERWYLRPWGVRESEKADFTRLEIRPALACKRERHPQGWTFQEKTD